MSLAKQKHKAKFAAINPTEWLMHHRPPAPSEHAMPAWLDAGMDAIASHGGCVISALSRTPDLRAEIVLAHLLNHPDAPAGEGIGEPARSRIFALAEAFDRI